MMLDFDVPVTLIEREAALLPGFDPDIQTEVLNQLKQRGLTVYLNATVIESEINEDTCVVTGRKEDEPFTVSSSHVLVSVGRTANTDQLGLSNTNITTDEAGFIEVNDYFQTKESHIYAVGDCIGGKQLAHVASAEGKLAVKHMFDEKVDLTPLSFIPS